MDGRFKAERKTAVTWLGSDHAMIGEDGRNFPTLAYVRGTEVNLVSSISTPVLITKKVASGFVGKSDSRRVFNWFVDWLLLQL